MSGDSPLIVTTIQKLNTAIKKSRYESAMAALKDKRVVFIFDECHRSQFGDTHKNIVKFFSKVQMFGFTGTPIFKDNASTNDLGKRTTKDLFTKALHKYVITNAIADDNVLKFSLEYWGKLKNKEDKLIDEKVTSINKKEFFENPKRIEGIVDWVIAHHNCKTHNRHFSSMMCVSNVGTLIKYYELFKEKKEAGLHDLRVITVFTFGANDDDADADGLIGDPDFDIKTDTPANKHNREKLEQYVKDYNKLYQTQHSVKDGKAFYAYYKNIAKRIKERDKDSFIDKDRADILLVVNMFLTGFDAKKLNTLQVDKNLKYHGLIQAYSRTNRTLGELKSQGNIVCFRQLKDNTDEAVALFSDTGAQETIFVEPYDRYVEIFNQGVSDLRFMAATPDKVNQLSSEEDQVRFVRAFRKLMRTLNILKSFTEFSWIDLDLSEQEFEDYKSKYLDIYDRSRSNEEEGASIVEEVDFELELIHRDKVNVAYILKILAELNRKREETANDEDYEKHKKIILKMLSNETQLRSKRDLIERFINDYLPKFSADQDIEQSFSSYWSDEKKSALSKLCQEEKMDEKAVLAMIDNYHFCGKEPLRDVVFSALEKKPKLMEHKPIFGRFILKFKELLSIFDEGIGNL